MLRRIFVLIGLVFLASVSIQAQDKVEVFGGYSYQRVGNNPSFNQNGWELAGQYKLADFIGIVGDFDGHYGSVGGAGTAIHAFLFGPQVSFPSRVSPFAQFLIGGAHAHVDGATDTSFAWTLGFGLDYRIAPAIYWRVIQGGWEPTYLFGHTQNNARISTGIVIHF
jgi:opacity protein-like surface antigen